MAALRARARRKVGQSMPAPTQRMPMHASSRVVDQRTVEHDMRRASVIVVDKKITSASEKNDVRLLQYIGYFCVCTKSIYTTSSLFINSFVCVVYV